jgi:hypothetical protein
MYFNMKSYLKSTRNYTVFYSRVNWFVLRHPSQGGEKWALCLPAFMLRVAYFLWWVIVRPRTPLSISMEVSINQLPDWDLKSKQFAGQV